MRNISLSLFSIMLAFGGSNYAQDSQAKIVSAPSFNIERKDAEAGIRGTVKVGVDLDETGKVKDSFVYVGPEFPCKNGVDARARRVMVDVEAAVKKFTFTPAIKAGKPAASRISVNVQLGVAEFDATRKELAASVDIPGILNAGVVNGRAKYLPSPIFPRDAVQGRTEGSVIVNVVVDEKGRVINAQAIEGPGILHFPSRFAACEALFSPTIIDGKPVKFAGKIVYSFRLV